MASRLSILCCGLFAVILLGSSHAQAAGLLTPKDGSLPALAIRDHAVSVVIEDGYAVTTVEQSFHNPNQRDLEAIYSFPVPDKAAVSEFTYWIDGKPVTGEVLPKEKATQVYEGEKAAGREAGVTHQDSHKTFDVMVTPVRAGQDVRVRLAYLQPAHIDHAVGRYVYPLEEGGVDDQRNAFWTAQEVVTGRFSVDVLLRSDYPVDVVRLPNQPDAVATRTADGHWRVHLEKGAAGEGGASQPAKLDRDIVVYWRLAENLPGSVDLVAYKPQADGRGTFMLTLTPGDDLQPIAEGRDFVFVLDKSGSMSGKFATLTEGVARALEKMGPTDRVRMVLFDDKVRELTSGFLPATPDNRDRLIAQLRGIRPDHGTNLYGGLELGLKSLEADRTSAVLLVTDGVANVGETRKRAFLDLVRKQDVRLFTFIMGNSANRPLLDGIARASGGSAVSISNDDDIIGAVTLASSKIGHQALHGVKIAIDGVRTADVAPRIVGSLYRGQQLVIFGHYWGQGEAQVTLSAKISGEAKTYRTRFDFPQSTTRNPEIERLWAFAAIEDLMEEMDDFAEDGEHRDLKTAVVDLAVANGLVTPFTSMVVVREERFQELGIDRANRARLAIEKTARETRAAAPVQQRRVDTAQPMSSAPRAGVGSSGGGHSGGGGRGGGAFDGIALCAIALLAVGAFTTRREWRR